MMKMLITTIITGFLFVSAYAFAEDYSQTKNKVDDKMNAPKKVESDKKDVEMNKQNNNTKEGERMNNLDADHQRRNDSK
ncbi:hypothetical protein [Nitrosomonas supralitoralis]|uniref:Pentapeptide MXKDX repeat protein n=1 Tax=Nitrosomonas supralitoralis TaxID=2116706 RepID=A0A2P7NRL9_9PROT|nr:hypothetical protein [Nitrosomonas supralitoralis]PSJ16115.1 hypothetical protein C7H79_15265 [Nitrosomonas supralitoralis]